MCQSEKETRQKDVDSESFLTVVKVITSSGVATGRDGVHLPPHFFQKMVLEIRSKRRRK